MWDKIALGFDLEDETVNFGNTRAMAISSNSQIYETNTLAVISNEEEKSDKDTLCVKATHCPGSNSDIVVIIDECVILFNNACTEIKNHYAFGNVVDSIACNEDGSLFFAALQNGDVHCISAEEEGNILLKNLLEPVVGDKCFADIFLKIKGDALELLIVCRSGCIYLLRNMNARDLKKILSGCAEEISEFVARVKCDALMSSKGDQNNYVVLAIESSLASDFNLFILMQIQNGQELCCWNSAESVTDSFTLEGDDQLRKLQISPDESLMLGLTAKGALCVICPYTLTILRHWTGLSVHDFEIMKDEDFNVMIFTKSGGLAQFILLSVRGFEQKMKLGVEPKSFLAGGQCSLEDVLYLEARREGLSEGADGCVSVYLKSISESNPEYRLERMLKREKFEEAESFAKNFNLNLSAIYKAKARKLLLDLQPWTRSETTNPKELASELKIYLDKIEDWEFVAECALNAISSDFECMKDLLAYANIRLKSHSGEGERRMELRREVKNLSLLLGTFLFVEEKPLTVDKWLVFCKSDVGLECQKRLKQGNLDHAIHIWGRHWKQMMRHMKSHKIVPFLKVVPSWVPLTQCLQWCQIFLPSCLEKFPRTAVPAILAWGKEKVE